MGHYIAFAARGVPDAELSCIGQPEVLIQSGDAADHAVFQRPWLRALGDRLHREAAKRCGTNCDKHQP